MDEAPGVMPGALRVVRWESAGQGERGVPPVVDAAGLARQGDWGGQGS